MDDIIALPISIFVIMGILIMGLSGQSLLLKNAQVIKEINIEAELIATNGEFSSDTYNRIERNVALYGDFIIKIRLDKKNEDGIYQKIYSKKDILDKKLKVGDIVHLLLIETSESDFERLSDSSIYFESEKEYDFKINKYITIPITKDGE